MSARSSEPAPSITAAEENQAKGLTEKVINHCVMKCGGTTQKLFTTASHYHFIIKSKGPVCHVKMY